MDFAQQVVSQAQRWHETDHGELRGKPVNRRFAKQREDDVPEGVPQSFRECKLCCPHEAGTLAAHTNPFWYRVVAWETDS